MQEMKEDFIAQLRQLLPRQWQELVHAIEHTQPQVSIRLNPAKNVANASLMGHRVPWCPQGYYLDERIPFTFDPAFQTGRYYVQEASSMFISHVVGSLVHKPVRYLDLCAAPGGKTTAALSALPQGSLVVANEIMPKRATVLQENIMKWGNPHCVVTCNRAEAFKPLTHFFDVVAIDAPCSGEGMMRKDDEAIAQWSPSLVAQCASTQRDIIAHAWHALKPGGLLIYSTCTYNRHENEEIVQHLIEHYGASSVEVPIDPSWHITPAIGIDAHCYRFMPHLTAGEGLFMAVLQKPNDTPRQDILKNSKASNKKGKTQNSLPVAPVQWLKNSNQHTLALERDTIVALPSPFMGEIALLNKALKVTYCGIKLATIKGKNWVPQHALALSTALNAEAFAQCEVDYDTAINYLRGNAVVISDAPRGYVLLTHHAMPLGFVNNLGNRANNLYPKSWRILNTHTPDSPPSVL